MPFVGTQVNMDALGLPVEVSVEGIRQSIIARWAPGACVLVLLEFMEYCQYAMDRSESDPTIATAGGYVAS